MVIYRNGIKNFNPTKQKIRQSHKQYLICCKKTEYRKEHLKLIRKFALYGKGRLHHIVN